MEKEEEAEIAGAHYSTCEGTLANLLEKEETEGRLKRGERDWHGERRWLKERNSM